MASWDSVPAILVMIFFTMVALWISGVKPNVVSSFIT
jgi:hypothetical protein